MCSNCNKSFGKAPAGRSSFPEEKQKEVTKTTKELKVEAKKDKASENQEPCNCQDCE